MPTVTELLERNNGVKLPAMPLISEMASAGLPPLKTMVVTCIDPRCIPEQYLNFGAGEVIVCRNAGGNVRHALRDITLIDLAFKIDEIAIVHHTDCGTLLFTDEQVREGIKAGVDESHWADVEKIEYDMNKDIHESVKGDLEWVRDHPLIRDGLKRGTQGFVFDIKTGKVEKVTLS